MSRRPNSTLMLDPSGAPCGLRGCCLGLRECGQKRLWLRLGFRPQFRPGRLRLGSACSPGGSGQTVWRAHGPAASCWLSRDWSPNTDAKLGAGRAPSPVLQEAAPSGAWGASRRRFREGPRRAEPREMGGVCFSREKGARRGRGPGAEERGSAAAGGAGGLTSASRQVHLQVGLAGPRGRGRVPPPRLLLGRLLHLLVVVVPEGSRAGVRDRRAGRGWGKGGGVGRYRAS